MCPTRTRALRMKRFLLLFAFTLLIIEVDASAIWVGQSVTCDASSAVMGLTSDISWSCSGGYISLSGSGFYRTATATQYWSGTATVKCTWKYRLYSNDRWRSGSRTWTFTCNDNPVSINPTSMELSVGQKGYVGYSHRYSNSYVSSANAYFSSTNTRVATVTSSGEVVGISPGTCYINVYSKVSANSPYCLVTVKSVNPTGVSLSSSASCYIDGTTALTPTLYPTGAISTFSWWSDDASIAKVSSSGLVTGVSKGSTKIWVKTNTGGYTDYCTVSVSEPPFSLSSTSPDDGAKDIPTTSSVQMRFSLSLFEGANFNDITFTNISTNSTVDGKLSISDKTLTFNPAEELLSHTDYCLYIPKGALRNKWGTAYSSAVSVTFTTGLRPSDIKYLALWGNDGSITSIPLLWLPTFKYDVENKTIICQTLEKEVHFSMSDIHKYTLETEDLSITAVHSFQENNEGIIRKSNNGLSFFGFRPNTVISVYTIGGLLVESSHTDSLGQSSLPMSGWTKGVYIIKAGNITYKILIK